MEFLTPLLAYESAGLFVLRLVVAIVFIYHGWPKIKGYKKMASGMGMPAAAVLILGLVETLSGLALLLGVYTQLAALLLIIIMLGAIKMKMFKWNIPFSGGNSTGWEYELILLAANAAILFGGGGSIKIM